jgi:hypothetical protein
MITVIDWPLYNSSFSSISAPRSSFFYMRLVTFFSIFAPACMWAAADPALINVKTVYVMPMGKGLDQYLANHLTQNRVFEVVTDPALADAVLSDRLGPAFEQALAELYPPPPEPPAEKEPEKSETKPAAPESTSIGAALADRPDVPARASSFSRGRGNVFIVDRKTKRVLWSDFRTPRNSQPQEIDYTADKLVDRLAKNLERLRQPPK